MTHPLAGPIGLCICTLVIGCSDQPQASASATAAAAPPQVPWRSQRSFDVVIAPDGSFQVQSGPAYIRGQVSQGHMQGQIVGDVCSYQFEADNSGTW
jgi:hypothetical protein